VLAERASGATLGGAIERVRSTSTPTGGSLFAALRRSGGLAPQEVSKPTMIALSHAFEDELSAQGERGLLVGAFQHRRFYVQAERRWRALARGARRTVVLADFSHARGDGVARPTEVPIPTGSPIEREWAIVQLAPRSCAVLVGRELPPRAGVRGPLFELVWSLDANIARDALSRVALLAASTSPAVAAALASDIESSTHARGVDASFATSLTRRVIAHLDRRISACA
jgi:DICT domain-containing protein